MNQWTEMGLGPNLSEEQARAIYAQGEEAVEFARAERACHLARRACGMMCT